MSAPKPKIVVQKSDVVNRIMSSPNLPHEDQQRFQEITLSDRVEILLTDNLESLEREISDASFLFTENGPLPKSLIAKAKNLKLIQNGGLRHNGIDLVAARAAGIPVAIAALPGDISVAEHALMLMMALGKKLLLADRAVRSGEGRTAIAPYVTSVGLLPLYGKTLGIVGLGEIGCHVVRRARAFEMKVLYYNRSRYANNEEKALGVEYRSLNNLMSESDIVSIHLAHVSDTTGIVGEREIAAMKPTSFLINTSRGAIVDEAALVKALSEGRISGAGLDVLTNEPIKSDHPLTRLENVILTPHISARGVVWHSLRILFDNIKRSLDNLPLEGVIN